uniref:Uncharacterized protein n=1 Tax=Pararge aegeria TaxID=116150 RepID=S4P3W2_9NEOP
MKNINEDQRSPRTGSYSDVNICELLFILYIFQQCCNLSCEMETYKLVERQSARWRRPARRTPSISYCRISTERGRCDVLF